MIKLPYWPLLLSGLCSATTASAASWLDDVESTFYLGVGKGYQQALVPGLEKNFNSAVLIVLTGDVKFHNFFIETPIHRNGAAIYGAAVGYQFYQRDNHSWDVLANNYNVWLPDNRTSDATPELTGLHIRNADSVVGLRYQYQAERHQLSVESGMDQAAHHGVISRVSYSYFLPWRNLDLYFNAALTYESAKTVNYYYGIHSDETGPARPYYQAGAGVKTHLGVSAIYPLAEHWLLDANLGVNLFSHQYLDSPVVTAQREELAVLMVRYVF